MDKRRRMELRIKLSDEEHRKVKSLAKSEHIQISVLARQILMKFVDKALAVLVLILCLGCQKPLPVTPRVSECIDDCCQCGFECLCLEHCVDGCGGENLSLEPIPMPLVGDAT